MCSVWEELVVFSVGGVSFVQCGRSLLCSVWEELVLFSVGGVSCVQCGRSCVQCGRCVHMNQGYVHVVAQ